MSHTRSRLDVLVVSRGFAPTRERARAMILAGDVLVDDRVVDKAGTAIDDTAAITVKRPDHPWVGRGGIKLAHALDTFGLDVRGITALDVGASTGGFTDVLLQRGAAHVVALDVGRAQLDWKLRSDPRVSVIEGVNARNLQAGDLPEAHRAFDLVTIDVSFISLRHILPAVVPFALPAAAIVALVKPQFEAGREDVGAGGIVRDAAVHDRVVLEVADAAHRIGWNRAGLEASPITGAEGNREFLLLLRRGEAR